MNRPGAHAPDEWDVRPDPMAWRCRKCGGTERSGNGASKAGTPVLRCTACEHEKSVRSWAKGAESRAVARELRESLRLATREQRRAESRARAHANRAAERAASPDLARAKVRRATYGISLEQQWEMLKAQNGRCAVCLETLEPGRRTHLDHDHATGKVRAFLCRGCNAAVGNLRDSPAHAERLAAYLVAHRPALRAIK